LLEEAVTERTRVIAVSWVQFFNGYKVDPGELTDLCKKHGLWLVIDGIQGMGVEPIDVRDLEIDIFTSGCQKWMLAPQGTGFFYLSPEMRDIMKQPMASWLGVDWGMDFTDLFKFELPWYDSARRFELGYFVVTNIFGMKAAVDIFTDLGIARIQKHNYALVDRLARYVEESDYYEITCDLSEKHRASIFTFSCDDVKALHRRIVKSGIVLSQREGSIRVAVHLFNNEDDIDRLIEVLEEHRREN
jgi:selenocysteine lyase/cysteine desulfurase